MSKGSGRTKRWERRAEARPGALTEAAFRLFSERGYAATRLDDVAAACGVSKGTVYLYFESKAHLFEAMARENVAPRLDALTAMVDAHEGSSEELLREVIGVFGKTLDSPLPVMAKLVIAESNNFPELAKLWNEVALSRLLKLMARVVERGVERGEFRPVEPEDTAVLVVAPLFMLGLWTQSLGKHTAPPFDPSKVLPAHVETLLRGLRAEEPTP